MKTKLFSLLILLFTISLSSYSQLKVKDNGQILVGNPMTYWSGGYHPEDADNIARIIVYGPYGDWRAGGSIGFGDLQKKTTLNVLVGEYTDEDTDQAWLHGKLGVYLTAGNVAQIPIGSYDVNRGNYFQFNCDVRSTGVFVASDSAFKEQVKPLKNTLSGLRQLNAVSYKLKQTNIDASVLRNVQEDTETDKDKKDKETFSKFYEEQQNKPARFGFIAQEVEKVYPELISKDSTGYMYVDYLGMIPLLTEALNELQTGMEEKNSRIESLETRIAELEDLIIKVNPQAMESVANGLSAILYQNVPNPFKDETKIAFYLPESVRNASLYVYNMQGSQLKNITVKDRGEASVVIKGSEFPAGMYIYALIADGKEVDAKRMILTK